MLHELITTHRDAIMAKMREKLTEQGRPTLATGEVDHGVSTFLAQLSETLRWETTATPFSPTAIGSTAARYGRVLLAMGFSVSQVVHAYGDICQAITALALEQDAQIGNDEFHVLNRCLDNAIAEAVTEHARITVKRSVAEHAEQLGHLAHELRDSLGTALLAFQTLQHGAVTLNGSAGTVLGQSLMTLRNLIANALSDVRLHAGIHRRERLAVADFIDAIRVSASFQARHRGIHLSVEPVPTALAMDADPELLASALMNLLNNAFKYTRAGGRVVLRTRDEGARVFIEVEDECGGIPDMGADPFQAFSDRRDSDRTGLGLGLSIARKAVNAHGGRIHVRNVPRTGCVFAIDLPLAAEDARPGA